MRDLFLNRKYQPQHPQIVTRDLHGKSLASRTDLRFERVQPIPVERGAARKLAAKQSTGNER